MTQPEESPPVPRNETLATEVADTQPSSDAADAGVGLGEEAAPQPWTPERVTEWNAYYDVYMMLGVLLLTFVVSAVKLSSSSVWTHLKTGQQILQQGSPVVSDSFSYTETGERWINIPWLFQLGHAAIYKLVRDFVPSDPNDLTANQGPAEQIAIGSLIGLNALVRLITAWILLKIRRRGPGLWWSAVCVTLALGAIIGPDLIAYGGIAGPGLVSPATWGLLLLALELLVLHRVFNEGRPGVLYALVPLFLIWANLDESFFEGLLILAAAVIGRLLDGRSALQLIPAQSSRVSSKSPLGQSGGWLCGPGSVRRGHVHQPGNFPDLPGRPGADPADDRAGSRDLHARRTLLFR